MIAVDTKDDQAQFIKSRSLFKTHEVFIADTVVLETEWVLRYAYYFDAESIAKGLRMLFGLPNVKLSNPSLIAQVLDWHLSGMDFADAFHLAHSQQADKLYTFDKKFIKKAKELAGCEVLEP